VVLGQPDGVIAELVGQPDLVEQILVYLGHGLRHCAGFGSRRQGRSA
jgi:hypothetical protein